ncbi:sulfite exporter TauE/SafE family protein [Paenibacillus pasadenensis]|uniref:sulfite exporter TauE/SafE family protein n=1 Tax=Paenibacillus pasadenensis TaxID=217090 RepID=UPI0020423649|nr:sulfite exporter TauE/SafE family protein [Paenibacillus pasadenensis]MCM3748766.1 sulfite exporter TauE/SafE family protein [Paenibacillus pasadenensis]
MDTFMTAAGSGTAWIIWGALLVGGFLQGSAGFGVGLFAAGIMTAFVSVKDATLIILALTIVMSSYVLIRLWRHVRWTMMAWVLAGTAAGRLAAYGFIHRFGETAAAKQWLGFMLIAIVIYLCLRPRIESRFQSLMRWNGTAAGIGALGGFIGGAFAVGGPVYALYFIHLFQDKKEYNATLQAVFILSNLFTLALHGSSGDLGGTFWLYTLTGIIPVLAGVMLGSLLFRRMSRTAILNWAYIIVALSAVRLIWS